MNELVVNRRASFDYQILETYEAGIVLSGFEAKAARMGRVSLAGSFVVIKGKEAWLLNATISPYQPANTPKAYEPGHSRKLLLHRSEIRTLIGASGQKGLTMVPLKLYNKNQRIKLLIGLAKHKKSTDKRETIRRREAKREIDRALKRG